MITVLGWTVIGALCGVPIVGLAVGVCLLVVTTVVD